MGVLHVNGIRLRANHGCLPEEEKIGGDYIVDITITSDFYQAEHSDELADTVDYCVVFEVVKREMGIRSKLIEHVAKHILDGLKKEYHGVSRFDVKVTKINPPINGPVDSVSFVISG